MTSRVCGQPMDKAALVKELVVRNPPGLPDQQVRGWLAFLKGWPAFRQ